MAQRFASGRLSRGESVEPSADLESVGLPSSGVKLPYCRLKISVVHNCHGSTASVVWFVFALACSTTTINEVLSAVLTVKLNRILWRLCSIGRGPF